MKKYHFVLILKTFLSKLLLCIVYRLYKLECLFNILYGDFFNVKLQKVPHSNSQTTDWEQNTLAYFSFKKGLYSGKLQPHPQK